MNASPSSPYCPSRLFTIRRKATEVMIGSIGVGADNPIRIQSMTTSDTQDVRATVKQAIELAEVGCEIVRITAPNVAAAACLKDIRSGLNAAGFANIPLVADIHFLPQAAMEAVEHVEKIRINPGNYADKKKFASREYSDSDYERELQRLHEAVAPLILRCRQLGRSLRIGTNHGSLSDRIMNRYGDSPLGMVESALEFVSICESLSFHDIVLSMKASNPKVVIQAYRLLVSRMDAAHRPYPLHLGVTEAGDGEDGRIKSAIGIGSLLVDGIGDTIRVSLTEDSVHEIPVAKALAEKAMKLWAQPAATHGIPSGEDSDPFGYSRRDSVSIPWGQRLAAGASHPPRVITHLGDPGSPGLSAMLARLQSAEFKDTPAEGIAFRISHLDQLDRIPSVAPAALVLHVPAGVSSEELRDKRLPAGTVLVRCFEGNASASLAEFARLVRERGWFLAINANARSLEGLAPAMQALGPEGIILTLSDFRTQPSEASHAVGAYRALAANLKRFGLPIPLWIRASAANALHHEDAFSSKLLEASILAGGLFCDGFGDLLSIESETDPFRSTVLAYNVLQGAGTRISKTEYVACPSCGRTLFDLQTTTQRIRSMTGHLKGVKIAIMGCIVNGPGEMADADFGYVGGAPGKINLYVGKNCVQFNIPQSEADGRLIALIKTHGKWSDPEAVTQ